MPRNDLDLHFSQVGNLISEIEEIVPPGVYRSTKFRADLAGLLVVSIAATYENCVKEIMCEYALRKHVAFGGFATRNFQKLSSRVKVNDLEKYCEVFDPEIRNRFKERLSNKKKKILNRIGKNIETSYNQILDWRHEFAHSKIQKTTIEEAAAHHLLGKRIVYLFDDAFNRP